MSIFKRLLTRFRDREYRRSYVESFVDSYLATQIKVLREQRDLTQQQLADRAGVKQSQICRWENVENSSWQVRSLKNLADALDLVLVVKFASFGEIVPDIEAFGRKALERPSFDDDPVFGQTVAVVETQLPEDPVDADQCFPDQLGALRANIARTKLNESSVFDIRDYRRVA